MSHFKNNNMKDDLQRFLERKCVLDAWVKNQIKKKVEIVSVKNTFSISSIKQKNKI